MSNNLTNQIKESNEPLKEQISITTQENKGVINNNSFIPALNECERFVKFLDKKFNLNLPSNYVITINKASKNAIGFFMCKEHNEKFINSTQDLNNINLNTYYLKENNPFEVLAHETAHFINYLKGVKDCSSNQYHNKKFKAVAEMLFLKVDKGKKGYNITSETEEFNKIIEEFKPNKEVFNIFQQIGTKKPSKTRNKLFMCSCGVKVRCATELNAVCLECNTQFIKEDE